MSGTITHDHFRSNLVKSMWGHTYSPLTVTNLSPLILVPLLRYPLPPIHPVCERLLDPPVLAFCLSHRHPYSCIPLSSLFICYDQYKNLKKKKQYPWLSSFLFMKGILCSSPTVSCCLFGCSSWSFHILQTLLVFSVVVCIIFLYHFPKWYMMGVHLWSPGSVFCYSTENKLWTTLV